jgi:hypothetical protein
MKNANAFGIGGLPPAGPGAGDRLQIEMRLVQEE